MTAPRRRWTFSLRMLFVTGSLTLVLSGGLLYLAGIGSQFAADFSDGDYAAEMQQQADLRRVSGAGIVAVGAGLLVASAAVAIAPRIIRWPEDSPATQADRRE
jgi:hypothetical protein